MPKTVDVVSSGEDSSYSFDKGRMSVCGDNFDARAYHLAVLRHDNFKGECSFVNLQCVKDIPGSPKPINDDSDVQRIAVFVPAIRVVIEKNIGMTLGELDLGWTHPEDNLCTTVLIEFNMQSPGLAFLLIRLDGMDN